MSTQNIKESVEVPKENINTINHPQVIKRRNSKNTTFSMILIGAGIAALVFGVTLKSMASVLGIVLVVSSIVFILMGILLFAFKGTQKIYETTGSVVKPYIHYFDKENLRHFDTVLPAGDFEKAMPVSFLDSGNAYLNVLLSEDKRFAAAQLFEFVPFIYESASPVYYFNDRQAENFANYISRCKIKSPQQV